ncbi:MAG: YciI family protein [Idiomarina sp.]|nr:YciI family protein [Idiomarina sp.]
MRCSKLALLAASTLVIAACAQTPADEPINNDIYTGEQQSRAEINSYNPSLAAEFGADQYGMRVYVLAILRTGPAQELSQTERARLQRQHMETINELAEAGSLLMAGPFIDGGAERGIYLFNVSSIEDAQELAGLDPAIQAGVFELEYKLWYGSAALLQLNSIHQQIQKSKP